MKFWHRFSRSLSFQSFFWVMTVRWGQRKGFKETVSATKDQQYQHCNNSDHFKTWTSGILQAICYIQLAKKVFWHFWALKIITLVRLVLILNIISILLNLKIHQMLHFFLYLFEKCFCYSKKNTQVKKSNNLCNSQSNASTCVCWNLTIKIWYSINILSFTDSNLNLQ